MDNEPRIDHPIFGIMVYALAAAFGGVIASLASVRTTPAGFTVELSWLTAVVWAIGSALMIPCFRIIFRSDKKYQRRMALAIVVLVGMAGFIYPIRFIPAEKRPDILTGLVAAAIALGGVAGLLLLARRFLESDSNESPKS